MSDRAAVVVALAAVAGAVLARGPSPWLAGGVVVAALAVQRPWILAAGVLLLSGALAARAEAGLVAPSPGAFSGWVTLLTDPQPVDAGVQADVRAADGRHFEADVRQPAARDEFRSAHAGDRALVAGRLRPSPPEASWLATRHVTGVLTVEELDGRTAGAPWMQAANAVRDLLARGAAALPARDRPLFLGFVLGDTRGQAPDITDDFRGAGLSHLLAVSGQNVAFVLALAGPMLRRFGLRSRLAATLALILFFALVTRFEPSVLRASVMAALAVTAATLGRSASSLRLLAFAVAGLVLVDPFLIRSVGFQLSVGACIGIVLLSPPLNRALPFPRWLSEPLSVTLAAQAGVAPVLVAVFGGVPVAGVPANVVAAPLAGPVMIWGLSAGLVAGAVGGTVASALHWPTHVMISWIAYVARRGALLPLGELHTRELLVIAAAALVTAGAGRVGLAGVQRLAAVTVLVAIAAPAIALRASPPMRTSVTDGATLWRAAGVVLDLDGRVDAGALLRGLREAGVTEIDLVVARMSSAGVRAAIEALRHRYDVARVVVPSNTPDDVSMTVGDLDVAVHVAAGRLLIDIAPRAHGSASAPPV